MLSEKFSAQYYKGLVASDAERSEASLAVESLLLQSHMVTRNKL